jgi:hypothetical protein
MAVRAGSYGMLTTMLAALAHAPTAAPFNANFYITAATVIPVLFLAIAVQGRTYENLLKAFSDAFRRWMTPGQWLRTLPAGALGVLTAATAFAMLYSAVAEILAIYALYQQQARTSTAHSVLLAVMFMVIMSAAGPALVFGRVVVVPIARGMKWIFSDAEPEAHVGDESSPRAD